MDRLPSQEERQWLTHALKKVLARGGGDLLDAAPLVQPTNDWFPERWAATAAHGHRLAQRLLYYADLDELEVYLSAYQYVVRDHEPEPYDAGTAGWFAGIRNQRAHFGLQVRQFRDPEVAAGVLSHEVAHAWRHHHRLNVDDRSKEEHLTDVTTIALGFGILTTNNTDRYRSSGNWSRTEWSFSSAGYLPPQAMSYLLALWSLARGVDGERRAIERHLEPNQQSYFRAAIDELQRGGADVRALLHAREATVAPLSVSDAKQFAPYDPEPDEIDEPTAEELQEQQREAVQRRIADLDEDFEDCDECEPEQPCERHAPSFKIGPQVDDEDVRPRTEPAPRRFPKKLASFFAIAFLVIAAFAWWRQNHVRVFFDNPLPTPVTMSVDGEQFNVAGRPPQSRTLSPGSHHIIASNGNGEIIEHFDAVIERQPLFDAFSHPRFYVYSVGGNGIFHRTTMTYAKYVQDRKSSVKLIALQRWFAEDDADYLFVAPPDELTVGEGPVKRTAFGVLSLTPTQLANALYAEGRKAEAAEALRRALEKNPCDDEARGDLIALVDEQKARAEAQAWIDACDGSIEAHRSYQDTMRVTLGREALHAKYAERLHAAPTATNHYLLGRVSTGSEAIAEFREALHLDPLLPWARIALARQLLEAEQDAEAYAILHDLMSAEKVEGYATMYFAMAAVANHKEEEAFSNLPGEKQTDSDSLWTARWILARARHDWPTARVLLVEHEKGERTPETIAMRARLERDIGEKPVASLAEELERTGVTQFAGVQLRFEDALENGRFADAAAIDLALLHTEGKPVMDDVYSVEAAILAKLPDAAARAAALRGKLSGQPDLRALLDAAEGRITKDALMNSLAYDALELAPHAWFALAVHETASGHDATALFRKSAERSLDREFPYRVSAARDPIPRHGSGGA